MCFLAHQKDTNSQLGIRNIRVVAKYCDLLSIDFLQLIKLNKEKSDFVKPFYFFADSYNDQDDILAIRRQEEHAPPFEFSYFSRRKSKKFTDEMRLDPGPVAAVMTEPSHSSIPILSILS